MFHGYPYTDFHELNLDEWISKLKAALADIEYLKEEVKKPAQQWQSLQNQINDMKEDIEGLKRGDYIDAYLPQIITAIDEAMPEMIGRLMNFFIFGLTKDGYFTAMYPDNFNNIIFDTIADPESDLYGHLVLQF